MKKTLLLGISAVLFAMNANGAETYSYGYVYPYAGNVAYAQPYGNTAVPTVPAQNQAGRRTHTQRSSYATGIRPYVSAKVNYNMMKNDVKVTESYGPLSWNAKDNVDDDVLGGSIAAGIKAGMIRSELEGNLHQNAEKTIYGLKASVKNNSLMWNTYLDIPTKTPLTPYIGAGIGVARLKATEKDTDINKASTNFAWQVGAGTAVEVTRNVAVDLGYRYVDNGSYDVFKEKVGNEEYKINLDSTSHEIYLGMRYTF